MRVALLLTVLFALVGNASADTRSVLDWEKLYGRWAGTGEVSGAQALISLEFRPALGGRGRHLSFANDMNGTDGKVWRFRAEAIYQCDGEGVCHGHWYDSRGMVLPLKTAMTTDALVVDWGEAATERGRTTYRLTDKAHLEIIDEVSGEDGIWKTFGRTRVKRR